MNNLLKGVSLQLELTDLLSIEVQEEIIKQNMLEIIDYADNKKTRKAAKLIYNYHSVYEDHI